MSEDIGTELAKEAMKESINAAKEFAGKLVNPGLEEGGGIIQDTVKFWRFKNQINILLRAEKFLKDKGINPKTILPKTLLPLLENGSLEEDDFMQNKWASLLANAAASGNESVVKPNFPGILKELSSVEVRLLDSMYFGLTETHKGNRYNNVFFIKDSAVEALRIDSDEFDIMIDNLIRLQLCQQGSPFGAITEDRQVVPIRTYHQICFTSMGVAFVKACKFE